MRIFTSNYDLNDVILVDGSQEVLELALHKACAVLQISPDTDLDDLCPADRRAIDAVLQFNAECVSLVTSTSRNATSVSNLNTGATLLLISAFCYGG